MRVEVRAVIRDEAARPWTGTSRSPPSTRTTRVSTRVDAAGSCVRERPPGELRELPRHLHARRAAADDHEGHRGAGVARRPARPRPARRRRRCGRAGANASSSDFMRTMPRAELVVAEVGGRGAAGHDEAVVADGQLLAELVDVDLRASRSMSLHLAEDHTHATGSCGSTSRIGRGDLALREDAGGHLVEQRLEEVVVGAVDDRDAHRGPAAGPWRRRGRRSPQPTMTTWWRVSSLGSVLTATASTTVST